MIIKAEIPEGEALLAPNSATSPLDMQLSKYWTSVYFQLRPKVDPDKFSLLASEMREVFLQRPTRTIWKAIINRSRLRDLSKYVVWVPEHWVITAVERTQGSITDFTNVDDHFDLIRKAKYYPGLGSYLLEIVSPAEQGPLLARLLIHCLDSNPNIHSKICQMLTFVVFNIHGLQEGSRLDLSDEEIIESLRDKLKLLAELPNPPTQSISAWRSQSDYECTLYETCLFRLLIKLGGGKVPSYDFEFTRSARENADIIVSVIKPCHKDPRPFGVFNWPKMYTALLKCPVFLKNTQAVVNILGMHSQMASDLHIGFPEGYLSLPASLVYRFNEKTIKTIIKEFANKFPELPKFGNSLLYLLAFCSDHGAVKEWIQSEDSSAVYSEIVNNSDNFRTRPQAGLTLLALRNFQSHLLVNQKKPDNLSCKDSVDVLLTDSGWIGNEVDMYECMIRSLLRNYYTEGTLAEWIESKLEPKHEVTDLDKFMDQYWKHKIEGAMSHRKTLREIEKGNREPA